jgi:uncharacterized protein (DUF1684 family)
MINSDLQELLRWRDEKERSLREEYGWLALAGLHWLYPGSHRIGSATDCAICLPAEAPAYVGDIEVDGEVARFLQAADIQPSGKNDSIPLIPDTEPEPTFLDWDSVRVVAIERSGKLGLRVWDNNRPERQNFPGRSWFDCIPQLRVNALWFPQAQRAQLTVPNELGEPTREPIAGRLEFEIEGRVLRLTAILASDARLFVPFGDRSNGRATYGSGRYLYLAPPSGSQVVLDFNRAYNPPCAFTAFATCSLPPAVNRLPVAILAGEKAPPSDWTDP